MIRRELREQSHTNREGRFDGMSHMNRRRFLGTAAATAGTAATARSPRAVSGGGKRPNVLFIMTDQHRADCLGCDGNPVIRTPFLDSLARDGAVFTSAYSSVPSCTPWIETPSD